MIRHPAAWCDHPGCQVCFDREQAFRTPIRGTFTELDLRAHQAEASETAARMARYDRNP